MISNLISGSHGDRKNKYPIDPNLGFSTGPNIDERVPEFSLPDQNGNTKRLTDMIGENGALLMFYRSASW